MFQQERQILRRYGLKVNENQHDQIIKIINSNPTFKEDFQKIKSSMRQIYDEDYFIEQILQPYKTQISQKIFLKDHTYYIQAIDPQQIQSATEKAFFKSFNIQKNKLNQSQKIQQQKQITINTEIKSNQTYTQILKINTYIPVQDQVYREPIVKTIQQINDKNYCFCGKEMHTEKAQKWVQCQRQNCKGQSWYHYQCVGFTEKDKVQESSFVCNACKKYEQQQQMNIQKQENRNEKNIQNSQQKQDISVYDSGPQKKKHLSNEKKI